MSNLARALGASGPCAATTAAPRRVRRSLSRVSYEETYANGADRYDALVSAEDFAGNLLPAVERIVALAGLEVVELGAGTGRLTRMLAPRVRSLRAFDGSAHMLAFAEKSLRDGGHGDRVTFAVADNASLPVADASCDLSVEGWSIGHVTVWHPDAWRAHAARAVDEMLRVLRPGGTALLIETLGTGVEAPRVRNPALAGFYAYLENERGFDATWVRTDYRFASRDEAERLVRGFFGDALGDLVAGDERATLPECTGLWWRTK